VSPKVWAAALHGRRYETSAAALAFALAAIAEHSHVEQGLMQVRALRGAPLCHR
jgi:hypothetical protein